MSKQYSHPYEGGAVVDWAQWGPSDVDGDHPEREKKMLDYLEQVFSKPGLEQKLHLEYILRTNAGTEYLRNHEMNGAADVDTFRKLMPVTDYEAYREGIERIANGDKSPILSAESPVEVLVSSGTTGGDPKIYPVNRTDLAFRGLVWSFVAPALSRVISSLKEVFCESWIQNPCITDLPQNYVCDRVMPSLKEGKFLNLVFLRAGSQTPCGLPARTAVTSYIYGHAYQQRLFHPIYQLSSPNAVLETPDTNSAMYSHLLCALLQRNEIKRVGAIYATVLVKALRALEGWWPEICEDIATGTLNKELVQDETVREAVLQLLLERGAEERAELASSLRTECLAEDGTFRADGIIPRLWPNCEVIDTGGTGIMKAYLPSLGRYSNNMRIICTPLYSATEGFFGLNMDASLPPEETYYVLLPSVAYYEFIAIGAPKRSSDLNGDFKRPKIHPTVGKDVADLLRDADATAGREEKVLDLCSLEVGQQYELIVTTISGYCRLRMADILEVVGHYNNSPLFKIVRRKNTLLSVDHDKTDEEELHAAVTKAALILEEELPGVTILEYTSFTNLEEPGHYVIVWELSKTAPTPTPRNLESALLDRCCQALEASLNFIYREGRYEGIIGPLELNLVQPGTFDLMCDYTVSRGANLNQYKVPRGLGSKQAPLKEIVLGRVIQRHFCSTKPPFTPLTYKTNR